jgi:GTP:adenosylcobinamide-phosphate guanylyltransferase
VEVKIVIATIVLAIVEAVLTVDPIQTNLISQEMSLKGKLEQKQALQDLSKTAKDKDFIEDLTILIKTVRIPALMIKEDIIMGDINSKIVIRTKITVFIKDKVVSDHVPITNNSKVKDNMVHDQKLG